MQLLTNSFELPDDGWYQISALGEFPHNPTGLVQIVDDDSCRAMTEHFAALAAQPNFAGLLIDFDHFSLEKDKPSEAAGWITGLQSRPGGLWAQIRWSDAGEQAVRGGRYRFISPVWRQDECEDLGNKRVRPRKLLNAAVTNDPNIRGMMPLSNRSTNSPALSGVEGRPSAVPIRVHSREFAVPNRTAVHFARSIVLTNTGRYIAPVLRNAGPMTDEQRRAMFARMHGGGGSRGTRGASGPSGASGEPDTSYDPAANELSHIRPLGETSADEQPDPTAITYDPIRASEDRVRAIEQERDAIVAQRPPEPQRPDFSITDTRKLAADLMKQGKGTNEVTAAVKAAEAQNIARKAALERIKQDIRKAYPNDKAKQAQALSKYMQSLDARYQKQHDQWQKVSDAIDDAVAKANRLIEEEKARGIEERRLAEQKTRNAAASRNQKLTDAQERERLKQLAADKAAARRKAEAESKATKPAPEPKTRTAKDDVSDMTAEMKRRQFYWQSLQRGEMEAAMLLYPQADHMRNLQTLEDLAPPSKSKANAKAHKSVLAELEKEKP